MIEMSNMILNHDINFGAQVKKLKNQDPLLFHLLENFNHQTHEDFLTHTKSFRVFEIIVSSLLKSSLEGDYIRKIDGSDTEKINDFMRVFSHITFNNNPRLGLLYYYLFTNDQYQPDLFCKKVIPLVNPKKVNCIIEEIDIYLFCLWLLSQSHSEDNMLEFISNHTPLSEIISLSSSSFKNYYYSELAKYLYSIEEIYHFTQKRV